MAWLGQPGSRQTGNGLPPCATEDVSYANILLASLLAELRAAAARACTVRGAHTIATTASATATAATAGARRKCLSTIL